MVGSFKELLILLKLYCNALFGHMTNIQCTFLSHVLYCTEVTQSVISLFYIISLIGTT